MARLLSSTRTISGGATQAELDAFVGTTNITTTGTIGTGTWAATDVAVSHGGTGASTHTSSNVLIGAGTGAITSIAPSTDGNVLTSTGSAWNSEAISHPVSRTTGSWTPVWKTGDPSFGTTVSVSGGTQIYTYERIGNQVVLQFMCSGGSFSAPSGEDIKLEGFPFTANGTCVSSVILNHGTGADITEAPAFVILGNGSTVGYVYAARTGYATSGYTYPNITSTGASYWFFSLSYLCTG